MSITNAELKAYRSVAISDSGSNGGLMSDMQVISGVSANLFGNASALERSLGAVRFRKIFYKVANPDNIALVSPRFWQDSNTAGQDRVVFFPASQRDTQSGITGLETLYGMGLLSVGELAGSSSLTVDVEAGTAIIFRDGDLIRVSDKATPMAVGNEFWVRLDAVPVVVGSVVTLSLESPLPVNFLSGAKVSSVYESTNIAPSLVGMAVSSAGGGIATNWEDFATATSIGSIDQNWTLTFTSATAFDISGDTIGAVGSGSIAATSGPYHAAVGGLYFQILSGLFEGAFLTGDTITFTTHPASAALWMRRTIPAGAVAVSNNRVALYMDGEAI